jgi:hypothetical protein
MTVPLLAQALFFCLVFTGIPARRLMPSLLFRSGLLTQTVSDVNDQRIIR